MKKWISLILLTMLLCLCAAGVAETEKSAVCEHLTATDGSPAGRQNESYQDLGAREHLWVYDMKVAYSCTECGDYYVLEHNEENEPHSYFMTSSVLEHCVNCERVKPCVSGAHLYNASGVCEVKGCGATCAHEKHTQAGKCEACGTAVEHAYDTDGNCSCGLVCDHAGAAHEDGDGDQDQLGCTDNGDETHTRKFKVYHYYECPTCGNRERRLVEENGEETEPHEYGGGTVCVANGCGAVKPCGEGNHTPTGEGTVTTTEPETTFGDAEHTVSYTKTTAHTCSVCSRAYTEVEDVSTTEAHTFDGAECTGCDYVCTEHAYDENGACTKCEYACAHENSTATRRGDTETLKGEYIDEGGHYWEYKFYQQYQCDDCGALYYSDEYEIRAEEYEAHSYEMVPGTTECVTCGVKKPCENGHTAGETVKTVKTDVVVTFTEADHTSSYTETATIKCASCYHHYTAEPKEVTATEAHTFDGTECTGCDYVCTEHVYDENGACTKCEYECAHENSTATRRGDTETIKGEYIDEGGHYWEYKFYQQYQCDDCGALYYSDEYEIRAEEYEAHSYEMVPGTTECVTCGVKKPCENGHTAGETISTAKTEPVITFNDDEHTSTYTETATVKCANCYHHYTAEPKEVSASEAHTFEGTECTGCDYVCTEHVFDEDGACTRCEYQCAHENEEFLNKGSQVQLGCKDNGDETHTREFEVYHDYKCLDCGAEYKKYVEVGTETEPHEYGSGTVCVVDGCGAIKPCDGEHTKGEVVSTEDGKKTYTFNEAGHVASYDRTTVYACSVCKRTFSETETVTDDRAAHIFSGADCKVCDYVCEDHTFEDGACTKCEYVCTEHEYEDGVCAICGERCKHETSVKDGDEVRTYGDVEYADDDTHILHYTYEQKMKCEDCGMATEGDNGYGTVTGVAHEYTDGKCVCGSIEPCQTHTRPENVTVTNGKKTYESSADGHVTYYPQTTSYVCAVCGHNASETETVVLPLEAHNFSGGDCVCGYPEPDDVFVPDDDDDDRHSSSSSNKNNNTTTTVKPVEPVLPPVVENEAGAEIPAGEDMVSTLLGTVADAQATGAQVVVKVVGAEEVMVEEEYETLRTLSAREQIMVTLSAIGFEEVVQSAVSTGDVKLTDRASELMETISTRVSTATAEENAALEEKLAQYFPRTEIEVDGVMVPYFIIDLEINVGGEVRIERYGFRLNENGEWVIEMIETL